MEILRFQPRMGRAVARCYNALIEPVPYCHPVPAERFASMGVLAHRGLREETVMVARAQGGEIVGFVHVGLALTPVEDWQPREGTAVIRFLSCRPGQRSVGKALLERAERWARSRAAKEMWAWHQHFRYRFYHFPCAHLSERIAHVGALFGMAGYREQESELYLAWPEFALPKPEPPAVEFDLRSEWQQGPLGPRLVVWAVQGEENVGRCCMDRGQASPAPDAPDWCYCDGLWVREHVQGKRLGTFLLTTGLREMHKAGCRHAAISTASTNYRAALFYTNLGYRFADRTVSFAKDLSHEQSPA